MKHLYSDLSKEDIAKRLLVIADEKLLVKRIVNKYRNNSFYSTIFNQEEVESELYYTVLAVINSLEKYNNTKNLISKRDLLEGKLTKKEFSSISKNITKTLKSKIERILKKKFENTEFENEINNILSASTGDLKLDNESQITGYLIVAFTNNIRKIYAKHQTDKRSFNEIIYFDSYSQEGEDSSLRKNKLESLNSFEPDKEHTFNKTLVDMALFLKKYDKKINQVNQNEKSKLAQLFCSIVNPKKVNDSDELKEKFGWSQYLLNKNKEVLIKKLKEEFQDSQEEILGYLDQRETLRKAV